MKINTYIITGFLGSGKTTLLNELIKLIPEQVGIIENEFGKVNIAQMHSLSVSATLNSF